MNPIQKWFLKTFKYNGKTIPSPAKYMTDKDMSHELNFRLDTVNKASKFDDRTIEIITELLQKESAYKQSQFSVYMDIIVQLKSAELKGEFIRLFACYMNDFSYENSQNLLTDLPDEESDYYSGYIDGSNYEKTFNDSASYMSDEEIKGYYDSLSLDHKGYFVKKIGARIPKEILLNYLSLLDKEQKVIFLLNLEFYPLSSKEKIDYSEYVSFEDLKEYLANGGTLEDDFCVWGCLTAKASYEDIVETLVHITDEKTRSIFVSKIYGDKIKEHIDDFMSLEEISVTTKAQMLAKIHIENEETEEKIYGVLSKIDAINEKCLDEILTLLEMNSEFLSSEFISKILSHFEGDAKNKCLLKLATSNNLDYDQLFEVLKSASDEELGVLIYNIDFHRFSEEQLEELMNESNSVQLRKRLLETVKTKSSLNWIMDFIGSRAEVSEEKTKRKDPEYLIVDEKNYLNRLLNARSKEEIYSLLNMHFSKMLTSEDWKRLLYKKECDGSLRANIFKNISSDLDIREIIELCIKTNAFANNEMSIIVYLQKVSYKEVLNLVGEYADKLDTDQKMQLLKYSNEAGNFEFDFYEQIAHDDTKDVFSRVYSIQKILSKLSRSKLLGFDEYDFSANTELEKLEIVLRDIEEYIPKEEFERLKRQIEIKGILAKREINEAVERMKNNNKKEMEEYISLFEKITGKDISKFFNEKSYYAFGRLVYLIDDDVFERMSAMWEDNHDILNTINTEFLNPNVLKSIDERFISFVSRYSRGDGISEVVNNPEQFQLFVKIGSLLSKYEDYPEEHLVKIITAMTSDCSYIKIDADATEEELFTFISVAVSGSLLEDECSAKEYEETIIKSCDEKMKSSDSLSLEEIIDLVGKRFFGMSYKQMKEIVDKYGIDIDTYLKHYTEKEALDFDEECELSTLVFIRNIREILNAKDKDAIKSVYEELSKDPNFEHIDFRARVFLDESIRRVYAKDYLQDLYKPQESDAKIVGGIKVYEPETFNMVVHTYGAFSGLSFKSGEKTAKEIWNSKENVERHILCTCLISDECLCHVKEFEGKEKHIMLGFCQIDDGAVAMSGSQDVSSYTMKIESQKAEKHYAFKCRERLLRDSRIYNELSLERRLKDNPFENIQPSYVICYETVSKEEERVAKELGVPIVLINRERIASKESSLLEKDVAEFEKGGNPELISKIIDRYESNITSFATDRKDLIKKFFNPKKFNKTIMQMIDSIDEMNKRGEVEKARQCFDATKKAIEAEILKYDAMERRDVLHTNNLLYDKLMDRLLRIHIEPEKKEAPKEELVRRPKIQIIKSQEVKRQGVKKQRGDDLDER